MKDSRISAKGSARFLPFGQYHLCQACLKEVLENYAGPDVGYSLLLY